MNVVKEIQSINEKELQLGLSGTSGSWHQEWRHSAYIFIANLDYDLTEGDVRCICDQYGSVIDVKLVRDHTTGRSKGFGFVCYEDQRSTDLAVDNLNNFVLLGRTLRVDHANYKPEQDPKNPNKDNDEWKKSREKKREKQQKKEEKRQLKEQHQREKLLQKQRKEAEKFEQVVKKRKEEYQDWKNEQHQKEVEVQQQEERKLQEWMERNKLSAQVGFKVYDPTKPGTFQEQLEELKKRGSFFGLSGDEDKIAGVPLPEKVRDEELDKGFLPDYRLLAKQTQTEENENDDEHDVKGEANVTNDQSKKKKAKSEKGQKSFLQQRRDTKAKLRNVIWKKNLKDGKVVDVHLGEKPKMDISEIQKKIGSGENTLTWPTNQ